MKAVILAAGYGRRMQGHAGDVHKALIPVAGTTILERTMDALCDHVSEFTIVTGHQSDEIRAVVAKRYPLMQVHFVHNERYAETNNVVSLSLAFEQLTFDADVLIVECDLLFDTEVLKPLMSAPAGNIALVDRWRLGMDGTVVSVEGGVITQVWPPHLQRGDFNYADKFKTLNIYRFDAVFCRDVFRPLLACYARIIDGNAFYELVLGTLINVQRHEVEAQLVTTGKWAEVDDPNDLMAARFVFEPTGREDLLASAFGGLWNFEVLDFTLMRNAHFPTEAMIAAMRYAIPQLLGNYGSSQVVLNQKLAWFLRCSPRRVQALHGASQGIPLVPELVRGRRALLPSPTFGEWNRAFPGASNYIDSPGVDLCELEEAAADCEVVVIVSPNNPTGTTLSSLWIHSFAAQHPSTQVVVDESFVDFCHQVPVQTRLEAEPLDNVIIIKSLSKVLGVPGLRVGYCYSCDEELVVRLGSCLPVWNLSSVTEYLMELLLKHRVELAESIERTILERARLRAALSAMPVVAGAREGGGNFVLVRLRGVTAAELRTRLLVEHGIFVKDVSTRLGHGEWLRVGVRTGPENSRLLDALSHLGKG